MIFFSVNQLYSFCLVLCSGLIFGLIYSILGVIFIKNHQNNIFNFIFKFILGIIFSIFLVFSINIFYFGQFNLIIIVSFSLGFWWSKKTLEKLLDFFEIKFYYVYIKLKKLIKFYFERKHESIKD
ncbi:MAG: spore cortex biosynthesis protein YabQ [Clostridia bacterium]